jgi:hypothetical protein
VVLQLASAIVSKKTFLILYKAIRKNYDFYELLIIMIIIMLL